MIRSWKICQGLESGWISNSKFVAGIETFLLEKWLNSSLRENVCAGESRNDQRKLDSWWPTESAHSLCTQALTRHYVIEVKQCMHKGCWEQDVAGSNPVIPTIRGLPSHDGNPLMFQHGFLISGEYPHRFLRYFCILSISSAASPINSGLPSMLRSTASSMVAPILLLFEAMVDGFALNRDAISLLRWSSITKSV